VVRSLNDKNAQLQKQLDNVVREGKLLAHLSRTFLNPYFTAANGEISLLNGKMSGTIASAKTRISLTIC
jgi:hypothetical protein